MHAAPFKNTEIREKRKSGLACSVRRSDVMKLRSIRDDCAFDLSDSGTVSMSPTSHAAMSPSVFCGSDSSFRFRLFVLITLNRKLNVGRVLAKPLFLQLAPQTSPPFGIKTGRFVARIFLGFGSSTKNCKIKMRNVSVVWSGFFCGFAEFCRNCGQHFEAQADALSCTILP